MLRTVSHKPTQVRFKCNISHSISHKPTVLILSFEVHTLCTDRNMANYVDHYNIGQPSANQMQYPDLGGDTSSERCYCLTIFFNACFLSRKMLWLELITSVIDILP